MTDIITPGLEVVDGRQSDGQLPDPEVVELFTLAQGVLEQSDTLLMAVNASSGVFEQNVVHAADPGIRLSVRAQKAAQDLYGIGIVFAQIGIVESPDEMYICVNRRAARAYRFGKDPYVALFIDTYKDHLLTRKRASADSKLVV